MTFLQSPNPMKRIYFDFTGLPNGAIPAGFTYTTTGTGAALPEIYSGYLRMGESLTNNTQKQAIVNYTSDKVNTDDQILRINTGSGVTGLVTGITVRSDAANQNSVYAVLTSDSNFGIWSMIGSSSTKRATASSGADVVGDTWALKAESNVYTLIRNPNPDNTGGSVAATWTDTGNVINVGPNYRYGAMAVTSDRNFVGTPNWSAGIRKFDFRDLKWAA